MSAAFLGLITLSVKDEVEEPPATTLLATLLSWTAMPCVTQSHSTEAISGVMTVVCGGRLRASSLARASPPELNIGLAPV